MARTVSMRVLLVPSPGARRGQCGESSGGLSDAHRCSRLTRQAAPRQRAVNVTSTTRLTGRKHAIEGAGLGEVHFHDLRLTGNTFAAASGAAIKDLMARMGHDSERAARICRHAARGADKTITSASDGQVEVERRCDDGDGQDGGLVSTG